MNERLLFSLKILKSSTQRKHVFRWLASLQEDYLLRHRRPWLVFDAIDFLSSLELDGKHVFEYGSGGSTLFWLAKGARCVSIEHDRSWYTRLKALLPNTPRLDYRLSEPEADRSNPVTNRAPSDPESYATDDRMLRELNFRKYASQIDEFEDGFFDAILVDGRARPSCIKHSARKVKPGGILILDNADRPYYTERTQPYLRDFICTKYFGVTPCVLSITQTNVYTREPKDIEI